MTEDELQQIENAAKELVRNAGRLVTDYFEKPLTISYKSPNNRSPVTSADQASDAYLRREILLRFPEHTVLSEEVEGEGAVRSRVTWIVDPLDGTNNFMNGLPVFGVSVGVFEGAKPVVGAIFLPSIQNPEGHVFHARLNGGTKRDGIAINLNAQNIPSVNALAALPAHFWRTYRAKVSLRRSLGEVRSTGSIAFEMAMVSSGVFQYALFSAPKLWDIAAGVVLVRESGGTVLVRHADNEIWQELEQFLVPLDKMRPSHDELRNWRGTLVVGHRTVAGFVANGLQVRTYRISRMVRNIRNLFKQSP